MGTLMEDILVLSITAIYLNLPFFQQKCYLRLDFFCLFLEKPTQEWKTAL